MAVGSGVFVWGMWHVIGAFLPVWRCEIIIVN